MGYSKVIRKSDTQVAIVHQLNMDGTPYAEDVTIDAPPGRLDWFIKNYDGKVGVFNFSFSPVEGDHSSIKFLE